MSISPEELRDKVIKTSQAVYDSIWKECQSTFPGDFQNQWLMASRMVNTIFAAHFTQSKDMGEDCEKTFTQRKHE